MKKQTNILRTNARAAKTRLGGGFWHDERDKRGTLAAQHLDTYMRKVRRQFAPDHDNTEDTVYEQIREILTASPYASPLACVLNREHMETLSASERERYVFETSARVQKCIERYNQEKELGIIENIN